ncbi:hypothetical protein BH09PLA1_BH09PLA1_20700 [soil metagenome]
MRYLRPKGCSIRCANLSDRDHQPTFLASVSRPTPGQAVCCGAVMIFVALSVGCDSMTAYQQQVTVCVHHLGDGRPVPNASVSVSRFGTGGATKPIDDNEKRIMRQFPEIPRETGITDAVGETIITVRARKISGLCGSSAASESKRGFWGENLIFMVRLESREEFLQVPRAVPGASAPGDTILVRIVDFGEMERTVER